MANFKRKFPELTDDKIIERYNSGLSMAEAGKPFGSSRQRTHDMFKKRGIKTRKNGMTPWVELKIVAELLRSNEDNKINIIAGLNNISQTTVYKIMRKYGFKKVGYRYHITV